MLFLEYLDYPVTPDNDRKERNHVGSFSLLQRTLSLSFRHIFVLLSITFYPLDSTMSLFIYGSLSFLRLRRIGNLSLKKDAGQAGMTKKQLKIFEE
jgi:hypothetical protein